MIIRLDDRTVFYKLKPEHTLCCLILASYSDRDSVFYFAQQVIEIFQYIHTHKNYIHVYIKIKYTYIIQWKPIVHRNVNIVLQNLI